MRSRRGDDVSVVDAFCENLDGRGLTHRIVSLRPNVLGFNCSTHTFLDVIPVLEEVKRRSPSVITVLGGYHATFASENILKGYPCVDYILRGEGERSLVQLLDCIEGDRDVGEVEGVCFRENGGIICRDFPLIQDLDSLPFPARDLVSTVKYGYTYKGVPLTYGRLTTLSTSRGCPFSCTYCSCAALSLKRWRPRSAENVVKEIEELSADGYENCVLVDDNFTHDPERVERICDLIMKKGIDMRFYCEGRVDRASSSLLRAMRRAGFNVIYFGVESASKDVLDYYNKRIRPEKAQEAIKNAKKAGMLVVTSFIFGAPVETKDDIASTIRFIRETRPHGVQVNILDCLIGTPIWNGLIADGLAGPDDWRTNHRIYEYPIAGFTKGELEQYVNDAYAAYVDGWKSARGIGELFKVVLLNGTARRAVIPIALNPNTRKLISGKLRTFQS